MPKETSRSDEAAPKSSAERDAEIRAGIYVALTAAAVVVLISLAFLGRSARVYAAGTALGLDDVALKLEQGSFEEAREKLREVAPTLREMGWDTTPEVDAALRRLRGIDRGVYLEALRYLTGHEKTGPTRERPGERPPEGAPQRDVWPRPQPQPPIYPSAI
jgi:hypothetical protein